MSPEKTSLTPGEKLATFLFSASIASMMIIALCAIVAALLSAGCVVVPPPIVTPAPAPPVSLPLHATVWRDGAQFVPDGAALVLDGRDPLACAVQDSRVFCALPPDARYGWHAEIALTYEGGTTRLEVPALAADIDVTLPPGDPPLLDKTTLIRTAQEHFGGIKLPGCNLHLDNLFDPFLLIRWLDDRACYERMMDAHAQRGDNTVSLDPRSGYHGYADVDLWHDPATFAAFVRDVRRHTNNRGEHFRVRIFFGGDSHIANMRDVGAFDHWKADVDALAAQIEPYTEFVVPCWECRHDDSWVSAKTYYDMLAYLGQRFPRAVHSVHLIAGSSAPSSWPCDPQQVGSCKPGDAPNVDDLDDPARGNEPGAWVYMLDRGLVDEFLYQFETGGSFLYADSYPQNSDAPASQWAKGAMGRWWDITVRLGDDPWSQATACAVPGFCGRRAWRQVAIKAWEFIYDAYWDRDPARTTEAEQTAWCQKALALGGWGCGSASYRRPQ